MFSNITNNKKRFDNKDMLVSQKQVLLDGHPVYVSLTELHQRRGWRQFVIRESSEYSTRLSACSDDGQHGMVNLWEGVKVSRKQRELPSIHPPAAVGGEGWHSGGHKFRWWLAWLVIYGHTASSKLTVIPHYIKLIFSPHLVWCSEYFKYKHYSENVRKNRKKIWFRVTNINKENQHNSHRLLYAVLYFVYVMNKLK